MANSSAVLSRTETAQDADNVLVAEGLTKVFAGFAAVKDVNLAVRRGSIHALIGPNGAGKTTCFNLLTKTLAPTSGKIVFDGEDISSLRTSQVARRGLVRSFQISATFPNLTARENVRVALQSSYGTAYQFWRSLRAVAPLNRRADELLDQVGLANSRETPAAELSYGKKRALEIATTLALEPRVMLLDEPTAGMGHEDIEPITDLIKRAAVGRTVLLVEHNLSVVSTLCDKITVLQHGQVLAEGNYAEVSNNPAVVTAYMGGVDE
ncbi:ABC transporter ATP-binding protein [Mesorhizobium sp. J428]|uniref:ABC transporter ATP-binding protein n=1 Tax=Mesorhizobium sp. J428 TaxID=2898440 RepID=UPI00215132BD|nr:ABC transporter ATP-binding protein [Mesorhizobium sp. J428]MCR5859030.1 ABC transporter ATP-binding protein [Mesorhizobium sp. J428]